MADWFLILATCISFGLLLVAGVYFMVYYQHPDDRNEAWFPKLTVILGFVLAGATVLLLPLDVANNEGYSGCDGYDTQLCGGLDMHLFWDIFYWAIPAFVFLLVPFMTFFYEADDGMLMEGTSVETKRNSRICEALKYQVAVIIVMGAIFITCFLLLSDASIPVQDYTGSINGVIHSTTPVPDNGTFIHEYLGDMNDLDLQYMNKVMRNSTSSDIVMRVSIPTFLSGIMSFFGWFFFALFGGIGLAALPLDLILAFVHRPRHMDAVEFAEAQVSIRKRVNELVDLGELMKIDHDEKENSKSSKGFFSGLSKEAREERRAFLEFKKSVYLLEQDVEDFQNCSAHYKNYNPLFPFISLLFGMISIVLTIAWMVQVALYVLPKEEIYPFLNLYFAWFDNWFPLFGVLSVATFSLYLLLCALKGCFKFGLRFVFFTLHPMKPGKTYMSSFMFNIGLVLLCALPVVQFSVTAFADYARFSTVSQVMGTQVQYLKFFTWFWEENVFVYALLGVFGLTTIYLMCRPRDTSTSSIYLRDRLKTR